MPSPDWEGLGAFLQTDDFAVVATIVSGEGASRSVSGIFDEPFLDAQLGEYSLDGSQPRFTARASDLAGVARHDEVTIGGVVYLALGDPQEDGTGMAVLPLVKQEAGGAAF